MRTASTTSDEPEHIDFASVCEMADAILYGSSPGNPTGREVGVLAPRRWVERDGPVGTTGVVESWRQQTECLVQARPCRDTTVVVRVRFLQSQAKDVERYGPDDRYERVAALAVGGTRHQSCAEAVPHEHDVRVPLTDLLEADRTFTVGVPGGVAAERLGDADQVIRRRWPITGAVTLGATPVDSARGAYRLRVRVENTDDTVGPGASRDDVLRRSLIATHTVLGGHGLGFISLIDPPGWAREPAAACRNLHTFPVLAAPAGDLVLSSPILLGDYPLVAPENAGDAPQIDDLLSVRPRTATDVERRKARAPRRVPRTQRMDITSAPR